MLGFRAVSLRSACAAVSLAAVILAFACLPSHAGLAAYGGFDGGQKGTGVVMLPRHSVPAYADRSLCGRSSAPAYNAVCFLSQDGAPLQHVLKPGLSRILYMSNPHFCGIAKPKAIQKRE